jgi:uncharacterized membrane protein
MHGPRVRAHPRREQVLFRMFELGVWLKGIDGVLEICGGLLLLLTSTVVLNHLVIALTQHEFVEDPQDRTASGLRAAVAQLSANTKLFGGAYLIAHGLIKLVVVVGLLRGYRWAYPVAIAFLCLFILYQP